MQCTELEKRYSKKEELGVFVILSPPQLALCIFVNWSALAAGASMPCRANIRCVSCQRRGQYSDYCIICDKGARSRSAVLEQFPLRLAARHNTPMWPQWWWGSHTQLAYAVIASHGNVGTIGGYGHAGA